MKTIKEKNKNFERLHDGRTIITNLNTAVHHDNPRYTQQCNIDMVRGLTISVETEKNDNQLVKIER